MSTKNKKLRFAIARYHPRVQGLQEITLRYEGESAIIHVRPPDISASGMFISTSRVLPEGAIVTVECKLAQSGAAIRARGEVRYCLRGVGVGVEFTEIAPEAVRAIEREIRVTRDRPLAPTGSSPAKRSRRAKSASRRAVRRA